MNTRIFIPIGFLIIGAAIFFNQLHALKVKESIESLPTCAAKVVGYSKEPIFSGHDSYIVELPIISTPECDHPILLKFTGRAYTSDISKYSSTKTNITISFKYDAKDNIGYLINNNIPPGGAYPYYALIMCFMGIVMFVGILTKKM